MYLQKEWQIRFTMLLLKLCLRKNDFLSRIIQNLSGCFLNRKNHSLNEGLFECKPVPFKQSNLWSLVLWKCSTLFRVKLKKMPTFPLIGHKKPLSSGFMQMFIIVQSKVEKMPTVPLSGQTFVLWFNAKVQHCSK